MNKKSSIVKFFLISSIAIGLGCNKDESSTSEVGKNFSIEYTENNLSNTNNSCANSPDCELDKLLIGACDFLHNAGNVVIVEILETEFRSQSECLPPFFNHYTDMDVRIVSNVYGSIESEEIKLHVSHKVNSISTTGKKGDFALLSIIRKDGYYHPTRFTEVKLDEIVDDSFVPESQSRTLVVDPEMPRDLNSLMSYFDNFSRNFDVECESKGARMEGVDEIVSFMYEPHDTCMQ